MKGMHYKQHNKAYTVSNDVMKNGILIECRHGLKLKELRYICKTFSKLIEEIKK